MNLQTPFVLASLAILGAGGFTALSGAPQDWNPLPPEREKPRPAPTSEYLEAIRKTAGMVADPEARRLAGKYSLNVMNITWEDTARYMNSSVGPNISDMTIQVGVDEGRETKVTAMPVIRFPNFTDLTCDLDPRDFTLMVGNEKGRPLKRVSLYDFLENPTMYLSNPQSWLGRQRTLVAPRDSKVLVSAQACFLPVPKEGIATFNPVIFNYQSRSGDPAVLTILAAREGTSTTIIDNKRDTINTGYAWGQRLFFNKNGQHASFNGQRLSDFRAANPGTGGSSTADTGLSMVLLIQVPLKQKNEMRFQGGFGAPAAEAAADMSVKRRSDVETAVIGHGEVEGPFTEIDNLAIERDPRYPIRVTVQFYKATSNGVVSEADIREIKQQIDRVYARSNYVGSLVTDGRVGRVTEYDGMKVQPANWWNSFWQRHYQNTGETRLQAISKLRRVLGPYYMDRPVCDLYLRDVLR